MTQNFKITHIFAVTIDNRWWSKRLLMLPGGITTNYDLTAGGELINFETISSSRNEKGVITIFVQPVSSNNSNTTEEAEIEFLNIVAERNSGWTQE